MTNASRLWSRFRDNSAGNTIVEFALILPAFIMIIIGGIYLALLTFTASSLHYATEAGARCASVNTTLCNSNTATATYALSRFLGPTGNPPTFTAVTATCGHSVTGSMTYKLDTGLADLSVPLSSTACFP
jgi:Flp pilus assembly protein TadG